MWNLNVAVIAVILSIVVHSKCVGESEEGFDRKRFDLTFQSCMDNFDVHTDMIIRTQDSRAMGAKYLNEAEVNGREECQKLCCGTESCDVYVYEQKVPGSCYLFHCGSPEDFKCKFTQHRNYTSAILTVNNHLNELENQIKLTKHEEELNNLRKPDVLPGTTNPPVLTSTKVPDPVDTKTNLSSGSQCSRYQFECRGSGECIAIYNACDGIPQCSDGSDEAPELDCPTLAGTTRPKISQQQPKTAQDKSQPKINSVVTEEVRQQVKDPAPHKPPTAWQQSPSSAGYVSGYGTAQANEKVPVFPANPQKMDPQQQLAYQARTYGREGEVLGQQYPPGVPWQGYPLQRPDDATRIFTHKGTGLVPDNSDRYSNREDVPDRIHNGHVSGPYSSDLGRSDYFKYATGTGIGGNGYYNGPVYYPNNIPLRQQQQQQHGVEEIPQRPGLGLYGNGLSGLSAPGASDYYYEDPQMRARVPILQDPRMSKTAENRLLQSQILEKAPDKQPAFQAPSGMNGFELEKPVEKPKLTESVKKKLNSDHFSTTSKRPEGEKKPETTTVAARTETPGHGVAAELKMSEANADGRSDRPNGAILSLTLGVFITAIMVVLVGCRLRVVRRHRRRGTKVPHGDFRDPDFLVNGMYL